MDILRKELNSIYESQNLHKEEIDYAILDDCRRLVAISAEIDGDCRVITDASADRCYIFSGPLINLLGLNEGTIPYAAVTNSSDEDAIYNRMHPEDIVEKRMLEYEFFKYVNKLPAQEKLQFRATCHIRIRNRSGEYINIDNTTRVLRTSPAGKIWLILCTYSLSESQNRSGDIAPRIINIATGSVKELTLSERRQRVLTPREKQLLMLIRDGKPSKQIADLLGISIHTVSRHRQNILEKLCVGNSPEAIKAAMQMKLL